MKKLLAIALAAAMLAAVSVPSFAADKTLTSDHTSDTAKVITSTKTGPDGPEATSYTVTFPAETTIYWGVESTDFTYNVKCQLKSNDRLNVTVAKEDGTTDLKSIASGNTATLPFSVAGTTAYTSASAVVADEAVNAAVNIASADWAKVPVDEYEGNLTLTVSISPATI